MYIASQKRKENIAEYLIYMWQIEDIIRANGLDIERIKASVIERFGLDEVHTREMTEWYESLIDMMRREEVAEHGHLQINRNVIIMLEDLHRQLLADARFDDYIKVFYATLPYIVELRAKSGTEPKGEVETCFNALYGMLMLRIKGQTVSDATAEAIKHMSRFIAMLSDYFIRNEHEDIFKAKDEAE